jgi:hypothetical protein
MPAIIRIHNDSSVYSLHEIDAKYYFHFGLAMQGNYLGQSELATPISWLNTDDGAGVLLTNEGLDFEEGEVPPPEDDPILYALGIRVMQDFGADWDTRGHYFVGYDLALEAFELLRHYESFQEWGQLAVIHGWGVPQRGSPCEVDDREEAKIGAIKRLSNRVATMADRLNQEHSEGTMQYRVIKSLTDQRAGKKAQRLSRYQRDPVI